MNLREERDGEVRYRLDRNYVRSVQDAGGMPVLMPCFRDRAEARDFVNQMDALLFTGGADIDPARWGQKRHPKTKCLHPERETGDFLAIEAALKADKPTLAICCGCQELNVALGGSLHQHVYDLEGVNKHSDGARHAVHLVRGSRLHDLIGKLDTPVNSYHHQACDRLGRGLSAMAHSPDALVEGIESASHRFMIGVQWHPERMPDDARQGNLFRALVSEARKG
jgi:gamma-glutamyl-gamma-aminobutyrate hydrolase PuuD